MKLEGTTMTKMKKLLFLFDTDPYAKRVRHRGRL